MRPSWVSYSLRLLEEARGKTAGQGIQLTFKSVLYLKEYCKQRKNTEKSLFGQQRKILSYCSTLYFAKPLCDSRDLQCSSDISEPKYTRNTRQPNTRIRVYIYANARMHIRVYAYTVYARMPH